jgi:hypothetical protein
LGNKIQERIYQLAGGKKWLWQEKCGRPPIINYDCLNLCIKKQGINAPLIMPVPVCHMPEFMPHSMIIPLFHPNRIRAGRIKTPYFPELPHRLPLIVYPVMTGVNNPKVFNMNDFRLGGSGTCTKRQQKKGRTAYRAGQFFYSRSIN